MSRDWSRELPRLSVELDSFERDFAFMCRVRAMHHWIRKQNDNKAYLAARDVFHLLRRRLAKQGIN